MSNPFQEQFLKLGLVGTKQVQENKKKQHQQKKQAVKSAPVVDENALLAQQAVEKKRARDLELNREREEKLRKREVVSAIKQIIAQNRLAHDKNGVAYRFTEDKKIQRIFVTQEVADKLSKGALGVVRLAEEYEVLPKATVEKVSALDAKIFVFINASSSKNNETDDTDDPYAEYKIPDDLMW